jgi:hypothetical protein
VARLASRAEPEPEGVPARERESLRAEWGLGEAARLEGRSREPEVAEAASESSSDCREGQSESVYQELGCGVEEQGRLRKQSGQEKEDEQKKGKEPTLAYGFSSSSSDS